MEPPQKADLLRYRRQVAFDGVSAVGQRSLLAGRALIVGVGGLGSWAAELLARAGVGFLRLVDDDCVELPNLHRQALYDEADAAAGRRKPQAAAAHLGAINRAVVVEPVFARLDRGNIAALADDVDVILDGTDNFATRFVVNDYAVRERKCWIFAGVTGAEAQTMTIVPGRTACLRCVYDSPPAGADDNWRSAGVLGPAVAAIAAIQAAEALKILAGRVDHVSGYLVKMDLWANTFQRIDAAAAAASVDCPCCKRGRFEFLEP